MPRGYPGTPCACRYMTLTVPEAGVISLTKLEGSVLEPGELLATVKLDDPTKIHKVCLGD